MYIIAVQGLECAACMPLHMLTSIWATYCPEAICLRKADLQVTG